MGSISVQSVFGMAAYRPVAETPALLKSFQAPPSARDVVDEEPPL